MVTRRCWIQKVHIPLCISRYIGHIQLVLDNKVGHPDGNLQGDVGSVLDKPSKCHKALGACHVNNGSFLILICLLRDAWNRLWPHREPSRTSLCVITSF